MRVRLIPTVALTLLACLPATSSAELPPVRTSYAVVVSKATDADPTWHRVVETLLAKHGGEKIVYDAAVADALPALRKQFPTHTCFVATPTEAGRQFVAEVNRVARKLDDDPYADTIWGILTGFDANNALAIASEKTPLVIRKAAAGTDISLDQCEQGLWYCELNAGKQVSKAKGGEPTEQKGPRDSTKLLADALTDYKADLFVTSGHATERDWQIGYRYKNGQFRSKAGELFGLDSAGARTPIRSDNPKVYLAVGNCLMGHIDGPDAMALAWMNSAGVRQMVGYTVLTWYGYNGWGMLDYFVEQPGRYSAAEAFHANQLALSHRLLTNFPELSATEPEPGKTANARQIKPTPAATAAGLTAQDGAGLLHDRDVVAFYGDPAWDARMADGPRAFEQSLARDGDVYTLTITPNRGDKSFAPVNTNGAQRGGRPFVQMLPARVRDVEIIEGLDLAPVVADDFVLIPNPGKCEVGRAYAVKFRARPYAP